MISHNELLARVADLQRGPWAIKGRRAVRILAPTTNFSLFDNADSRISLETLAQTLTPEDRLRESHFDELLNSSAARERDREPRRRRVVTSLHYALTELTLLDLAVATGYLPVDTIRDQARTAVVRLLWSHAARRFVESRNYVGVKALTNRLGLEWFEPVRIPEPARDSSVQFAMLLDHYRAWLEDKLVQEWVAFEEQYLRPDDVEELMSLLGHGRRRRGTAQLRRVAVGFERALIMLADLFAAHEDGNDIHALFGLVHLSELERLFSRPLLTDAPETAPTWMDLARLAVVDTGETVEPYSPENARFVSFQVRQLDSLDTRITLVERAWQAASRLIRPQGSLSLEVVEEMSADGRSIVRDFIAGLAADDQVQAVAAMHFLTNTVQAFGTPEKIFPGLFGVVLERVVIHFAVNYSYPDTVQITLVGGILNELEDKPSEPVTSVTQSLAVVQLAPIIADATDAFAITP
jgi:hypothetical protein